MTKWNANSLITLGDSRASPQFVIWLNDLQELVDGVTTDPFVAHAEREVFETYGDRVSVKDRAKSLNEFGRNGAVGTSFETVGEFQGTVGNETFATGNTIDSASSSSASDAGLTFRVEGDTYSGGNVTRVAFDVTLDGSDGTTPVTFDGAFRLDVAYLKPSGTALSPQSEPVGTVYFYDSSATTVTAGVPDTAAATKLVIEAGETDSLKASVTIPQDEYWFIEYFSAHVGGAGAASVDYITVRMESRDIANGGVWRPMGQEIVLIPGQVGDKLDFLPYKIVPKNHDWRIVAKTNANTAEVFAEAGGVLAKVKG